MVDNLIYTYNFTKDFEIISNNIEIYKTNINLEIKYENPLFNQILELTGKEKIKLGNFKYKKIGRKTKIRNKIQKYNGRLSFIFQSIFGIRSGFFRIGNLRFIKKCLELPRHFFHF